MMVFWFGKWGTRSSGSNSILLLVVGSFHHVNHGEGTCHLEVNLNQHVDSCT